MRTHMRLMFLGADDGYSRTFIWSAEAPLLLAGSRVDPLELVIGAGLLGPAITRHRVDAANPSRCQMSASNLRNDRAERVGVPASGFPGHAGGIGDQNLPLSGILQLRWRTPLTRGGGGGRTS